jgi:hypothetical protein
MLLGRSAPRPAADAGRAGGGLQVQLGAANRIDPNAPLRCFVNGQFVGMETTARCAELNGVPAGALDVGVDATGALAPGGAGSVALKPLPAAPAAAAPAATVAAPVEAQSDCLRFSGSGWRNVGAMSLNACVRTLFSGRCVEAGEADYGRWGAQTLRLVPGRVESSPDNRNFDTLIRQSADCSFAPA